MKRQMLLGLVAATVVAGCSNEGGGEKQGFEAQAGDYTAEERALLEEELARWRGRWRCLSRNEEGNLVPDEEVEGITLTVGGTMYHFQWGDDFDEFGRYKFHPDQNPKAMDVHIDDPPDMKGRVVYLIYQMDGDRLLLSHREDNTRPTDFIAEPESGQTVEEWVRVRPSADGDEPAHDDEGEADGDEPEDGDDVVEDGDEPEDGDDEGADADEPEDGDNEPTD